MRRVRGVFNLKVGGCGAALLTGGCQPTVSHMRALHLQPTRVLLQKDSQQAHTSVLSAPGSEAATPELVWALWNEGNLFSLTVSQLQGFLRRANMQVDSGAKKAVLVRQVEEHLQSKDAAAKGSAAPSGGDAAQNQGRPNDRYGRWDQQTTMQPEALLDLAQAGFYEGGGNMAPKAFQLLITGTAPDVVVSRVNTTSFPGFPANTECYTLGGTASDLSVRSRYSKALQWCFLNMSNLQMDGELAVDFGKMLLHPKIVRKNRKVIPAYTLQQRVQYQNPYTWVSSLPEKSISTMEEALTSTHGFQVVGKGSQLVYEAFVKRARDVVILELNDKGNVLNVNGSWSDVQTSFLTHMRGPDLRILLRSRLPIKRADAETLSSMPIVKLTDDDVVDVLPPEQGQLIYLTENEVRRFEKRSDKGIVITVKEIKRQPLIVVRDDEEDPRTEYVISASIPANAGRAMDVRALGMELFDLAHNLAATVTDEFIAEYGCEATPGTISE